MFNRVKTFLFGLLYEQDEPSLTRVIIALAFVLFAAVSLYLCVKQIDWGGYSTFATITGGGAIGGKIADKVTAIIKGSPAGQMPGAKNGGSQ